MSFLYLFRIFKYSELTSCNVIRCKIKTCIVIRNRWKVITSQILKQKLLLVCWPNLLLVRLVRLTFWPDLCIFSLFYQNNFGFTSLDILTSNIGTLCAWELCIKKLMQSISVYKNLFKVAKHQSNVNRFCSSVFIVDFEQVISLREMLWAYEVLPV